MGEAVIVVRGPGRDAMGDPVAGTTRRRTVQGCLVALGSSAEAVAAGRDTIVSDYVIYMPPGADVGPTDQLVVRGVTCEVVGRPFPWVGMSGWEPGIEVRANVGTG